MMSALAVRRNVLRIDIGEGQDGRTTAAGYPGMLLVSCMHLHLSLHVHLGGHVSQRFIIVHSSVCAIVVSLGSVPLFVRDGFMVVDR